MHTRYRSKEEEDIWEKKDPVQRFTKYVTSKGLWEKKREMELVAEYKKEVDRCFEIAENHPPYPLEDVFQYMYAETPDDLKNQMMEYRKFKRFKEGLS